MKPVTELYEAALQLWPRVAVTSAQEAERLRSVAERLDGPAIAVLDLVATLPPERLGLVRWVVGLGELDIKLLGAALSRESERLDTWEYREHAKRMAAGYQAALSGGEVGAKCPECHDTGKVKRLEGGGSVRVVKHDPCPKCAAGAAQAMEEAAKDEDTKPREPGCQCHLEEGDSPCRVHGEDEDSTKPEDKIRDLETRLAEVRGKIRSYDGGDRPSSPPIVLLREEDDLRTRIYMLRAAQYAAKPKPTILPAGKPPPFVASHMVLRHPEYENTYHVAWPALETGLVHLVVTDGELFVDPKEITSQWTLVENFPVEGER